MTARIEIDPNVRVQGNRTFAGFEDIDPHSVTVTRGGPVVIGEHVLAVESESRITADATVVGLDYDKRLVYLAVDWHSFRETT